MATPELIGSQASATFSGTEGSAIGNTLYGQVTAVRLQELETWDVTPWSGISEQTSAAGWGGTIKILFTVASMTPPILSGTDASLVVNINRAGSKRWSIDNARVVQIEHVGNGVQTQKIEMTFRISAAKSYTNPVAAS